MSKRSLLFLFVGIVIGYKALHLKPAPAVKQHKQPRLVIALVVDQLASHYLHKLEPFLQGGLKQLLTQGHRYNNAVYPHAIPSTATGHAALSTGTTPRKHGIISNSWVDREGKICYSTNSDPHEDGIFSPTGQYERGASSKNLMVDSLADSFVLSKGSADEKRFAFALSAKDRSAIMLAGRMGKAFWFDEQTGRLTTSRAYYEQMPSWLTRFNAHRDLEHQTSYEWRPVFAPEGPAYNFSQADNYQAAGDTPRYNSTVTVTKRAEKPFELYKKTPLADELVLNAAYECLTHHFDGSEQQHCLLWISLSSLDLAGHFYGPHSLEAIDMIYQIDLQLKEFFERIKQRYPEVTPLITLTGDHGVMPIPEVLQAEGYDQPVRINSNELIEQMNETAAKITGIEKLIIHHKPPQFFFDKPKFAKLSATKQNELYQALAALLRAQPGIQHVWTKPELEREAVAPSVPYDKLFKQSYYPERSGEICCLLEPYHMLTPYPKGTSHTTPYLYDTKVPLVIWYPELGKSVTTKPVSPVQLPATIAQICNIPLPSADEVEVLPGFEGTSCKRASFNLG